MRAILLSISMRVLLLSISMRGLLLSLLLTSPSTGRPDPQPDPDTVIVIHEDDELFSKLISLLFPQHQHETSRPEDMTELCHASTCGVNAQCGVADNKPVCQCRDGFTGDPELGCETDVLGNISQVL